MNKIFLLLCTIFISFNSFGQTINVIDIRKITDKNEGEFYFPKYSPDGSKIFFTSSGYKGLYYYDLKNQTITKINDEKGAGYEFKISADGNDIYYRTDRFIKGRKFSSLKHYDFISGSVETIEADKRGLSTPQLSRSNRGGKVIYTIEDKLKQIKNKNLNSPAVNETVVFIEDSKIVLVINGSKKILTPLGEEGHYIWSSLSPDKSKILFTYTGKGTYISDLNGNIISELGYANAPVFSPDGNWIAYMVDADDGHKILSSDIFIKSIDGDSEFQLTNSIDIIEMYPEWSPDGKEISFHSLTGEIYIMNLSIDPSDGIN